MLLIPVVFFVSKSSTDRAPFLYQSDHTDKVMYVVMNSITICHFIT